MENPEQTLIIILAVTLSLFLIVAILLIVRAIQIITQLKKILDKAEKLADKAESVGEFIKHNAGPVALVKLLANLSQSMMSRRKRRKGKL